MERVAVVRRRRRHTKHWNVTLVQKQWIFAWQPGQGFALILCCLLVRNRAMDLFETIKSRRSVRVFQPKEVEPEKLNTILGVMMQAPSAGNLQAFQVYVIRDAEQKQALATAALNQDFIARAPVVLIFCADRHRSGQHYRQRGEDLYSVQDATIATAYAQLAATAFGLGTCWVGTFDDAKLAKVVGIDEGHYPIAMLPLGYPAEEPKQTTRRSAGELVRDRPVRNT